MQLPFIPILEFVPSWSKNKAILRKASKSKGTDGFLLVQSIGSIVAGISASDASL